MIRGFYVVMLGGLIATSGCEPKPLDQAPGKVTSEDVRRDSGNAVETAVEFSRQSKEEFEKKLDARLKDLDTEIAKLHEQGRDLKDQAKANWDRQMAELETKRNATRAKLTEVGHSSAEAWKDIRKGAQSA